MPRLFDQTIDAFAEQKRLLALHDLQLVDTPPEPAFDEITKLVATILEVPAAFIGLLDSERIFFKSRHGFASTETRHQGPRAFPILAGEPHVIADTFLDPSAAEHPIVNLENGYRFYAGAPLLNPDGHCVGVLGIVDDTPRHLPPQKLEILQNFAKIVMEQILLRRKSLPSSSRQTKFTRVECATKAGGVGLWEMNPENGRFFWNQQMTEIYGLDQSVGDFSFDEWLAFLHPGDSARVAREWHLAVARKTAFQSEYRILRPSGHIRHISSRAEILSSGSSLNAAGINLDFTEQYMRINSNLRRQNAMITRRKPPSKLH